MNEWPGRVPSCARVAASARSAVSATANISPLVSSMDALLESLAVLGDERLKRHRRPSAELLDEGVCAPEKPVFVVNRRPSQVVEEEVIVFPSLGLGGPLLPGLQVFLEFFEIDLL